ncbi:MAG: hypothetical protein ACXU86_16505 [Archangium sp.]
MTANREWSLGSHYIRFEQPDTLFLKLQGDVGLQDVEQITRICQELAQRGGIYLIADLAQVGNISADARRHGSKHTRPEWYLGVAYIGANFVAKAAAKGLMLMLYFSGKPAFDLEFVHDESEARAAIARQRAKHAAKVA